MTLHAHLDAVGGVAGDMFVAAVLDARPELRDGLMAALRMIGAPDDVAFDVRAHDDGTMTGTRFVVDLADVAGGHVPFRDIRANLEATDLPPPVKQRAVAIFTLLAEAEGRVHGIAPDAVTFHEVGAWDSIADIVGAAHLIEALGVVDWSCGALPKGSGTVETSHGRLPVPAPATADLLRGFVLVEDGLDGERVTPTGAAIIKHLAPRQSATAAPRRLIGIGTGFGTKKLPGVPNILRLLLSESDGTAATEQVAIVEFEVDDQSPEDLAVALDRLRGVAGVLDVVQWPVTGKKGRLGVHVQILARPESVAEVTARCMTETTTIGLRWSVVPRVVLPRESTTVDGADGPVRVKLTTRPGGAVSAKAEIDDAATGGHEDRERTRRMAEDEALEKRRGDDCD